MKNSIVIVALVAALTLGLYVTAGGQAGGTAAPTKVAVVNLQEVINQCAQQAAFLAEGKAKALAAAMGEIEKTYGVGSIMRLGGKGDLIRKIEGISTGSINLDLALGGKGLPKGRICEIYGPESSGKTTMIKLLTRLYDPSKGRITLDGRDLREWDVDALRERVGVIFQDFMRYQLTVGENIGVGDIDHYEEEPRWEDAAERGMAKPCIITTSMSDGRRAICSSISRAPSLAMARRQRR